MSLSCGIDRPLCWLLRGAKVFTSLSGIIRSVVVAITAATGMTVALVILGACVIDVVPENLGIGDDELYEVGICLDSQVYIGKLLLVPEST
jgi:Na+-translocating ferredoxin:NAD+ oxidoreductase RnfE subunit